MPPKKELQQQQQQQQQCIFPQFTDDNPEECSERMQRLTDNAWEKVTDDYKLANPWLEGTLALLSTLYTRNRNSTTGNGQGT